MRSLKYLLFVLFFTSTAYSQDRLFTYTYQSSVLGKGQREIEGWNTIHWGREDYYRSFKHRLEFELGLGGHFQTSFYLNMKNTSFQTFENSQPVISSEIDISFSNEWKYKMSDPVANALGSALYGELTVSKDEIEIEAKVILDKKMGHFTHALNLVAEPEFETEIENGEAETEMELSFSALYGMQYQVSKNLNIGFELSNRNKSNDENVWEYSTLFGGPCISYSTDKFWINFTIMPQLTGLYYYKKDSMINGKVLDENEKLETRLIFSFAF